MSKHTPVRLEAIGNMVRTVRAGSGGGFLIAEVRGQHGELHSAEAKANAALFAASPILFQAAEAALAYDLAVQQAANDPAAMSSFCTAQGDTLDTLYAAWITKAHEAVSAVKGGA